MDRAVVSSAALLEEAWAWGFDVDAWRAHVGLATWPEVLRQMAIVGRAGSTRPRSLRETKARLGVEGEDVLEDTETGEVKLKLPVRFGPGSVKAAAWQVRLCVCVVYA